MRVTFAIPGALETPTGGYAYARRLIADMPREGIALQPLMLPGAFPLPDAASGAASGAAALSSAADMLAALPPDRPVLIDGLAFGAFPESLLARLRAPVVALCHHPLALEARLAPEMAAHLADTERAALARAAHVVTTSRATAAILARDYRVPAARLTVAPPGTERAAPAHGSGGPGCRIVAIGSLTARKGHDRLLRALAASPATGWELKIIGPARDAAVAAALQRLIARPGLAGKVALCGALAEDALSAAYASADLFALASDFEGFGMAFAEAVAHGLPVLGLSSPAVEEATLGAAELVSPEDFPVALAGLIASADRRRALAGRSRVAARDLPRWLETVAGIAGVLRAVTGLGRPV